MNIRGNKDRFAKAQERMLRWDLAGRDITDPEVLRVMGEVRREEFVPAEYQFQAYADGPLPIGYGQTISQPYIVALSPILIVRFWRLEPAAAIRLPS